MTNSNDKILMSISSRSEGSAAIVSRQLWRNAPLHERCNISDMVKMKEAFQVTYRNKLLPSQFRDLLRTLLNVEYDDEEYKILFMKINSSRSGEIDWDELVSHLMLGYFANDSENHRTSLQLPIVGLPTVIRSHHRHTISRICFCPDVAKDRSTDPLQGTYITVSRDGMLNWWSLDMTLLRSAYSTSPHLKVCTTWVTDMVCLPDVSIIVTSSTERDLRFYDCTAKTFTLKLVITSWEYMICCMDYHFPKDPGEDCTLVCGDAGGNIRVLLFSPVDRGPFRSQPGRALIQLRHRDLLKNPPRLPSLRLVELRRVHGARVRHVRWYAALRCVLSCAASPDALVLRDLTAAGVYSVFRVEKGVQCFALDSERHVVVTGGLDRVVRSWSPFAAAAPVAQLAGHRAAVCALVLQDGRTAYSLARDGCIKAWDLHAQVCLQTYVCAAAMGAGGAAATLYRAATRELLLGGARLLRLVLGRRARPDRSDGRTHAHAVAAVLYNPLFQIVVTAGMDSIIINWDLLTGRRNAMVRDAHTRLVRGELVPVELTAACFDPGLQRLLTGARDGTLKVWNFNTGQCLRKMAIEHMCEVTNCFWVEGRILAVGWNRHVTEFDADGSGERGKDWDTRHDDDVLAAAARPPRTLATASYSSELVLWNLETGQPYRKFSCMEPSLHIKMVYSKRAVSPQPEPAVPSRCSSVIRQHSARESSLQPPAGARRARRVSAVALPSRARALRRIAVHAALALATRPCHAHVASLMVALEDGQVQGWSEHPAGGLRGSFRAVHSAGDYVSALASDPQNDYLFTGTTVGYIKVWLMTDYLTNEKVHVSMPTLRLTFPFLWRDRIEGRAKRSVRDQPLPLLLSSSRAHLRSVTALAYVHQLRLLLSGSSDCSVRVWRLSGEYLQTLGGVAPWSLDRPRFPPDVRRVASFTTLKVWRGGHVSRHVPGRAAPQPPSDVTPEELRTRTWGAPPPAPLLPPALAPPPRPPPPAPPRLDDSLPTVPLYAHVRLAGAAPVRPAATPPLVRATRLRRERRDRPPRTHFDPRLL